MSEFEESIVEDVDFEAFEPELDEDLFDEDFDFEDDDEEEEYE